MSADRLLRAIRGTAEAISVVLLAIVFAVMLAGVVARYVFHQPIAWSDELAMILLIWSVFIAEAFVVRTDEQVGFDMLWNVAGPRLRRLILVLQGIGFAALFAAALPTVADYVAFLWRERTSALQWRLDHVFSCFTVYVGALVLRLLIRAGLALGPGWRDQVRDGDPGDTGNIIG